MSDGQTLPAVRYRLSAYRYPLSYWTVFPKAGGGARLRRRGDSPALTRGLRVVFASLRGRIRAAALEYIPGRKRVQAPAAPGFYRSCADAPTDGFCPQSGLVQRGVLYAAFGGPPLVAGATTFAPIQGALWVLGNGVNLSLWQQWRENHTTGLRPEENKLTALTGDGNAPLFPLRGASPGGGSFSGAMLLDAYESKR